MRLDKYTVLSCICNYFEKQPEDIFKKSRKQNLVHIRQMFFYMCQRYTDCSLSEIGKTSLEHGRPEPHDHATVLYAIKTVKKLSTTDLKVITDKKNINKILKKFVDKVMSKEDSVSLAELNQIEDAVDTIMQLEFDNEKLHRVIYSLQNNGLNDDERSLLEMYRELPFERKKQVMFKVTTTFKINQKLTA